MIKKYIMPVLDKKDTLKEHKEVIKREFNELMKAIDEDDPVHILEELHDVWQGLIGLEDELEQQGMNTHNANLKHQKKLAERGWKFKGHYEIKKF